MKKSERDSTPDDLEPLNLRSVAGLFHSLKGADLQAFQEKIRLLKNLIGQENGVRT
jgi:hypothetical protein